ncbi:MAG TPA: hypothetical protein VJT70_08910 [Sphingomicrobium sp.]|nr:hypothetical protein [Sphingomicrobium sp.]
MSYTRPLRANAIGAANASTARLTFGDQLPYHAFRMTNLVAIAASSTARLWWRGATLAARWRD